MTTEEKMYFWLPKFSLHMLLHQPNPRLSSFHPNSPQLLEMPSLKSSHTKFVVVRVKHLTFHRFANCDIADPSTHANFKDGVKKGGID